MGFADDLLEQAYHLLNKDGDSPSQASLRRSVSTAYYALFHLLIDEAVGNWGVARQRGVLARTFEHRSMKRVCEDYIKAFYSTAKPADGLKLKDVAQTFNELQEKRCAADYDNSHTWTRISAEALLVKVANAFDDWHAIRGEEKAQDFLLALLLPRQPR
jgi:uncharacterized protein (UPF0332 family)